MADYSRYLAYGVPKANKAADNIISLPGTGIMSDLGKYYARNVSGLSTPITTKSSLPKVIILHITSHFVIYVTSKISYCT